ncbi:hypothetical protein [Gaetbulibacter sp. PBL-D1]|uniref:hypothetical protein n=1 Tax=Gaetbulibacter sp. PBL-D1 TaxID=3422594 RepID=UPI003D2F4FB8
MKEWQDLFIESKLNLNIAFNKIFTAGAKAQSLHQINHQSFNQLKKVMTEFPELNFNTTENHQLNHFNSVSSTSKQSNIEIYDAWKNTKKEDLDIVKTFFEETSTGFENYNLWISKTESYLTLKLYDLNYLESIIKNIFQENSMAKHLYSHIIKNKFYQINLPSNFSSNNIILE